MTHFVLLSRTTVPVPVSPSGSTQLPITAALGDAVTSVIFGQLRTSGTVRCSTQIKVNFIKEAYTYFSYVYSLYLILNLFLFVLLHGFRLFMLLFDNIGINMSSLPLIFIALFLSSTAFMPGLAFSNLTLSSLVVPICL